MVSNSTFDSIHLVPGLIHKHLILPWQDAPNHPCSSPATVELFSGRTQLPCASSHLTSGKSLLCHLAPALQNILFRVPCTAWQVANL